MAQINAGDFAVGCKGIQNPFQEEKKHIESKGKRQKRGNFS